MSWMATSPDGGSEGTTMNLVFDVFIWGMFYVLVVCILIATIFEEN